MFDEGNLYIPAKIHFRPLQDLVLRVKNQLKLSSRIKPPVEEVFVESSEEESEEEEEEEDKDFPPLTSEVTKE